MKILVVEDNPLNQKILIYYLVKDNYDSSIVATGEECIKILSEQWYDVILMDLMLPGMDGFETARQIRLLEKKVNFGKKTYIIALTANTLDNDRERCLKNGMDEYMAKPFDMKKLRIILETLNDLGEKR